MTAAGFSWILGRAFWDELALLQRTESSPDELARVRAERLAHVLRAAGRPVGAEDAKAALAALPAAERRRIGVGSAWRRRTSGSSGEAAEVAVGRTTYARMLAGFWRGMRWWGVAPGEPGLAVLGAGGSELRRTLLRTKDWALRVHRVIVDDARPWVGETRALLRRRPYAYVYGYPSALYELAVSGVRVSEPPRVVVTTGEPLFGFQRSAIENAFQTGVAEEFGCTELGTVAFQCPHGSPHVNAEQVWLEHVGSRTLGTSLLPRPAPLIRYPLDEPVVEQSGPCGCGLGLPCVTFLRRQEDVWRRFEEAAREAAKRAGLPARFTVRLQGSGLVRVPADSPAAQAESLAASVGPQSSVERPKHLPRRAAGKFTYLERVE